MTYYIIIISLFIIIYSIFIYSLCHISKNADNRADKLFNVMMGRKQNENKSDI